jgi:hypothetical protein
MQLVWDVKHGRHAAGPPETTPVSMTQCIGYQYPDGFSVLVLCALTWRMASLSASSLMGSAVKDATLVPGQLTRTAHRHTAQAHSK